MKLVVISPESDEPREPAVMTALFAAGLERYHVRKPHWSREKLATWLGDVSPEYRMRLALHQHHDLAVEFGCGGVHFKDQQRKSGPGRARPPGAPPLRTDGPAVRPYLTSRSCHDISALDAALGHFDSVFFSPIFPSISKPGYRPTLSLADVAARLERRTPAERKTSVIALGGITPANAARCAELGFDGVAVLGAVWQAADPVAMFRVLQAAVEGATPSAPKKSQRRARRPALQIR